MTYHSVARILETADRQTYLKITPVMGNFFRSDYSSGSPVPVDVKAQALEGVAAWVIVPPDNVAIVGDRIYAILEQIPCPTQP